MSDVERNKAETVPGYVDFVWVFRKDESTAELAYFTGENFIFAQAAGDREGQIEDIIGDVEEWQGVEPPTRR